MYNFNDNIYNKIIKSYKSRNFFSNVKLFYLLIFFSILILFSSLDNYVVDQDRGWDLAWVFVKN